MPVGGFGVLTRNHSRDTFNNYGTIDTGIVSSATADTFGSWVEMIADVGDRDIMIVGLNLTHIDALGGIELEVGIGAAASETRIFGIGKRGVIDASTVDVAVGNVQVSVRVPSGSRLAARVKDSRTTANTHYLALNYIKL